MNGMKTKQSSVNFSKLKIGCPFESLFLEKTTHYPILELVLNALLYIL